MEPEVFRRGACAPQRIGTATEEFVGTGGKTEALPDVPSRVGGGGSTRNGSSFDGFADNAKVRAEFIMALK
jgi:hypothetical protein